MIYMLFSHVYSDPYCKVTITSTSNNKKVSKQTKMLKKVFTYCN